jgi:uncharacterized membrane protein
MTETSNRRSFIHRLRTYFLTGFLVLAPLAITIYLTWSFVTWVDSWVKPYLPQSWNPDNYLPFALPGFGLIVALFGIALIGFLTANFIGRTIVNLGEHALDRMPLVRNIYKGLKQIFNTVLSEKANNFKKVGLIEYPRKGLWAIVFIATGAEGEIQDALAEDGQDDVMAVFLATTPNPTSGFLLFVPRKDVRVLDMSVEDGAKLIISAGLVTPAYQKRLRGLATEADAKAGKAA